MELYAFKVSVLSKNLKSAGKQTRVSPPREKSSVVKENSLRKKEERLSWGLLRRTAAFFASKSYIFTSVARYGIAVYSKPRLHSDPIGEDMCKLQVTQNKMFRLLDGKSKKDKVSVEKIAKKFEMMSINQMTCYHILMETYKIIHFGASDKLRSKLVPNSKMSKNLQVPLVKRSSCRGFTYFAAKLWNSLPPQIKMRERPCQEESPDRKRLNGFKKDICKWICDGGVPFK